MKYDPTAIERKWQKKWEEEKLYETDLNDTKRRKFYTLVMFPYPSGDKLHIGHWYNFAPVDSFARYMRSKGYNVFEPMGFDSFGLPAENYAIKTGNPPRETTEKNIAYMEKQLRAMGTMYAWSKEVVTSRPEYYKWTQWCFLELYKKGLAYKKKAPVNWCPSCQTVLANEQVQDGVCERCKTMVTKKDLVQWFLKIREYAEDLLRHDGLDWPEKTLLMQRHWIGKSEGSEVVFELVDSNGKPLHEKVSVFTTRIDTLFSCAFLSLAPEHPLVSKITASQHVKEITSYQEAARRKTDIDRTAEDKEKTGIFTGNFAINPINGQRVPVWVGDFVLMQYGTGAIFGDAHDTRDFIFAKKYKIPLKTSILPADSHDVDKIKNLEICFTEEGVLYNSAEFDGMTSKEARKAITQKLEKQNKGKFVINYKLRDWLISRQRYWGAPVPIINCAKCGEVPVPEKDLPVILPEKGVDYLPKGKAPLASVPEFINTTCPKCGCHGTREPDTMDTFVDSSWYFLRYLSPHDATQPFDKLRVTQWMPVDMYIGGPEHACMHLLYARFIHKVLINDRKSEPFKRLVHQGLITKDGAKMSKSRGNVVSPDEFIEKYGSDVFRMYMMFMGPFTDGGDWNDRGITGIARFASRFWDLMNGAHKKDDSSAIIRQLHATIKKVGSDIESFHFNTTIAAMMELLNLAMKEGMSLPAKKLFTQILSPIAPHLSEEVWQLLGQKFSIFNVPWPKFDHKLIIENEFELVVQISGKLRALIRVPVAITQAQAVEKAKQHPSVQAHLQGKTVIREVFVPKKLLNLVVK